jgi:hypothetical protein
VGEEVGVCEGVRDWEVEPVSVAVRVAAPVALLEPVLLWLAVALAEDAPVPPALLEAAAVSVGAEVAVADIDRATDAVAVASNV